MMRIVVFLWLFCSLAVAQAQSTVTDSIQSGGLTRYYTIYTPASYDGSEPVPVMLNLHGYGSAAFQQLFYGEFRPIADTANFLLVLPDGTNDLIGMQHWNTFTPPGTGVDDVAFISDLLDTLIASFNIDENRIYSTGMSNGGFMSYELACQLSGRIAAIASVTGSIDIDRFGACNPSHPMPIMEIHGTNDLTVPYMGGGTFGFVPIPDVIDYWVGFNNTNPEPEVIDIPDTDPGDGSTVEHYIYSGGDNGVSVEHFKVIDGGHTWPGTIFLIPSSGSTNKDINASNEIWRFFSQYRLDVLTDIESNEANELTPKLFPNPGNGYVMLELPKSLQGALLTVTDLNGRIVHEDFAFDGILDLSSLPRGIYAIAVGQSDGVMYVHQ